MVAVKCGLSGLSPTLGLTGRRLCTESTPLLRGSLATTKH